MLIRPRAPTWALALSLSVPAQALCADPVVPSVQISGARYDQRREETASSAVVGREELLRHGDRTLADALKRVAGVTIGDGSGRDSGIRLRGLGNGYTQILLNGVAAPNGFSLESLSPELIERVEIVRAASAELGAQSIAGTVNIVLRKAASNARSTIKMGLDHQRGAYSPSISGEAGGKGDGYSYAVPVTLSRTRVGSRQHVEEEAPALHRLVRQSEMNAVTNLTVSPRASWTLAGGDKVDLRGVLSANRGAVDMIASESALEGGTSRYPLRGSRFTSSRSWLRVDAGWTRKLADGARIEAKAGADGSRRKTDFEFGETKDGVLGSGLHFVHADFRDSGYHASTVMTLPAAGAHTLSLGWDGAHAIRSQSRLGREIDVPVETRRDDLYDGAIDRLGVFVQDAWEINSAWSLSAGWRWEALETSVTDAQSAPVRQRSVIASPILQVLYKHGKQGQLRLGLARTYKAPTMFTLIPRRYVVDNNNSATNPDTQGNPALRPEKAWGLDAGYDHYFGKDNLLAVSGYVRRIDDVTVDRLFLDGASWVTTPDNQGRALARGLALEAKFAVPGLSDVGFSANLARNWSRVERIPGPDNRLDEQAPLSANLGLEYRGAVKAGVNLTYARGAVSRLSDRWTSWNGGSRALDVYALWGSGSGMRVRLAAANLLEKGTLSGSRYVSATGARQTLFRTTNGAVLRLTIELDL